MQEAPNIQGIVGVRKSHSLPCPPEVQGEGRAFAQILMIPNSEKTAFQRGKNKALLCPKE